MKRPYLGILFVLVTALIACQQSTKTPPKIISFTATPSTLSAAANVKLEWVVENATGLSISPDIGGVEGTATTLKVSSSKIFTLTAKNDVGQDSKSVEVKINVANIPPSTVQVDTTLKPTFETIPSLEDGVPRPVATLTDKSGVKSDFVQNELLITTDDQKAVNDLLARWDGTEVKVLTPPEQLQAKPVHLIRVNASKADVSKLANDLQALDSTTRSDLKISNQDGNKLLAVMAREARNGLQIGMNWVSQSQSIQTGSVNEAPAGIVQFPNGTAAPISGYTPDVFNWNHFASNNASNAFPQNFGVADAWRLMSLAGRLNRNVSVAVIDGGFNVSDDIPVAVDGISHVPFDSPFNSTNPSSCTGGSPCPWHGTNVLKVMAATPDNARGTAGTAGPVVSRILTIHNYGDFATNISSVWEAYNWGAQIINMSFGVRVPALLTASVLPFNIATLSVRKAGVLIFAAAGNDGEDVDEKDCFGGCWEAAWHTPCENGGVICVGGLADNALTRAEKSNYGKDDVDIFGPFVVYAGSNPGLPNNQVVKINGTSGTSPFVAGIAALIWAANPSLSANQVEDTLINTAQPNTDANVRRHVNAFAAIKSVLGGAEFFKDRFEINDTAAFATPLAPGFYDGLSLHNSSDIDFYKFDFADEKSLVTFDFRYMDRLGNLNSAYLSSSKTNCGLPRLKKINSSTLINQRTLQYEVAQGSHTLRVGTANQNLYTMNIGVTGLPVDFTPDEFDTPTRNDSFAQSSQLGFRDNYSEIPANFDNGQDADWYVIYSSGTKDPLRDNGTAFHFDISSSDVPVSIEAYQDKGGKLVLYDKDDSTADCTKPPTLFLPDGMYYVRVSSSNFKHGNYVFGTGLHINLRIPKIVQLLTVKDIRPTPGGVETFELLGKSDGRVFTVPVGVKGVQILEQGFHAQVLDLSGNVLREGQAIFGSNANLRSSTRAGEQQIGEELSFDGLSNDQQYILGVFRNDTPDGLTEEEISRLPVIPYSLKVLSDALPDQTPPKAQLLVNTPIVLYPQTVTITADASDDVRVDGVAFYEDEQLVSMDTQAPYTLEMTYSMLRNGSHTYSAKIYDSAGNVALAHNTVNVGVDISNMIQNPGAELGFGESAAIPPVEVVPAFAPINGFTVVRYGSPNGFPSLDLAAQIAGESNFFTGGTASVSSATQVINVFDAASLIDSASGVSYELSGFLGGYADQNDYAEVSLLFLNENGIEVGSEKLKPVNATERQNQTVLLPQQATGNLPVGTRAIQLKITMTKVESDTRNDGYVDNLRFSLHKL
jgi:Subtilase family/Bacterial Ig domain